MNDNYKIGLYGQSLFNSSDIKKNYRDSILIASSRFNIVFLFTVHVDEHGNFGYGRGPLLVGDQLNPELKHLPSLLKVLRAGSVETVLFSIGSADAADWSHIKDLCNDPTEKQNLLNRFALLARLLNLDGFDFDLEVSNYDEYTDTVVELTNSLSKLGKGIITYCPYQASDFWIGCLARVYEKNNTQLVRWLNLQIYGGADAKQWIQDIRQYPKPLGISDADTFVVPGYSTQPSTPSDVTQALSVLPVKGAFIWNAEGTLNAPYVPRMFAKGIIDGLNRGTTFLGIGTDGSVRRWFNGAWEEHALFKGWTLKMLAIDNPGNYWCVSTQSNVGKWDGSNWIDQPKMDHWTLRMLAFDLEANIWCVGTENNIGKWDPNQEAWIDQKALNQNATIDSIAFGPDGTLYALGTFMSTKAVRAWNGDPNSGKGGWSGTRLAGGWTLKTFFLDADSQAWAVGISGNVGKLVGDNYVDQPEFSGFTLNWLMSPI